MTNWDKWALDKQVEANIKWKKWETMKPSDRHIHEKTIPISDSNTIRYSKGHYVTRPYLKYATSKWEQYYIDLYEVIFNHLKHLPNISLLEFGVFTGESISYFRDYFTHPSSKIVGFDPLPCEFYGHEWLAELKGIPDSVTSGDKYDGPTENVYLWNTSSDDSEVVKCCQTHGPFDIIIDDASHYPDWAERYFRASWPYLKNNGIYLIEDIEEKYLKHLLDEITITNQGRGVMINLSRGFGPKNNKGESVSFMVIKNSEGITGLDKELVKK